MLSAFFSSFVKKKCEQNLWECVILNAHIIITKLTLISHEIVESSSPVDFGRLLLSSV